MVLSETHDVQIICVTESWLNSDIVDAEVSIPNFNLFRADRPNDTRFGGSAIFVHKALRVERLDWFTGLESLAVNIVIDSVRFNVVCLYRSTSLVDMKDNAGLLGALERLPVNADEELVIVGDVNLPHVNWDKSLVERPPNSCDRRLLMESEFLNVFTRKGLKWYVTGSSTRVRKVGDTTQCSLLDQVFCNNDCFVNNVDILAPLGKSDHVSLLVELKVKNNVEFLTSKKKSWYKVDQDFVNSQSSDISWGYSREDLQVEEMWEELHQKLSVISDRVPTTHLKTTKGGEILQRLPWDCSSLVRKRKCKDLAWKDFEEDPTMVMFNAAEYEQRMYQNAEIKAKIKYENKVTKLFKLNCKPLFNYLKSKSVLRKSVERLKTDDGSETKSPSETAEVLADFFQSVFKPEPFGPLPQDCYTECNNDYFWSKFMVHPESVAKILGSLDISKAMGPDGVHPRLLRYLSENSSFVDAVVLLFSACASEQYIPEVWKTATVVALHKKGSVHSPNNYRPVSLTCILCKAYEKLLREYILDGVEQVLSSTQHGFMKGRSCLSNLLESIDAVNDLLAEGGCADILYFDFSKAFDSVPHHRLLVKLRNIGVPEEIIGILEDFLVGRSMKVKVGDAFSEIKYILSGVPQGSVLGPLLFLLFVNDLPEGIKAIIKLFADDVKMIVNPFINLTADLKLLELWESRWCLNFNVDKCMVMQIGSCNPKNQYLFGGVPLRCVESEKDLGVVFNTSFNFEDHVRKCIAKANGTIAWLTRNIISRETSVMLGLYKSLVKPHIEYCSQAWAPMARHGNWSLILELEGVQRSFTRMIDGLGLMTYRERLDKLNLTTLLERRVRGDLIEMFKIQEGFVGYGSDLFGHSGRTVAARSKTHRFTTNETDFFAQRVLRYWNSLPLLVKASESVTGFKSRLDAFRLSGYRANKLGHHWELSYDIFDRIDVTVAHRSNYVNYMKDNPIIAKRKKVNLKGLI